MSTLDLYDISTVGRVASASNVLSFRSIAEGELG